VRSGRRGSVFSVGVPLATAGSGLTVALFRALLDADGPSRFRGDLLLVIVTSQILLEGMWRPAGTNGRQVAVGPGGLEFFFFFVDPPVAAR